MACATVETHSCGHLTDAFREGEREVFVNHGPPNHPHQDGLMIRAWLNHWFPLRRPYKIISECFVFFSSMVFSFVQMLGGFLVFKLEFNSSYLLMLRVFSPDFCIPLKITDSCKEGLPIIN